MRIGGLNIGAFFGAQPDTPAKLAGFAFAFEHLEIAAYELLRRIAERGGEEPVIALAARIGAQERAMADRIAARWDRAVEASLREKDAEDLRGEVVTYLRDAHALEAQAMQLLEKGRDIAGHPELASAYEEHLAETRDQQQLVERRLEAHGGAPSALKDAVMRLGALNWGGFFAAQPDTPAKLAGFTFAFEHLEIAGYEQLKRVALRAGDTETAAAAEQIIAQERSMAGRLETRFERAVEASLEAQGIGA
jgi:ferritin-like metal-binding protein YciE